MPCSRTHLFQVRPPYHNPQASMRFAQLWLRLTDLPPHSWLSCVSQPGLNIDRPAPALSINLPVSIFWSRSYSSCGSTVGKNRVNCWRHGVLLIAGAAAAAQGAGARGPEGDSADQCATTDMFSNTVLFFQQLPAGVERHNKPAHLLLDSSPRDQAPCRHGALCSKGMRARNPAARRGSRPAGRDALHSCYQASLVAHSRSDGACCTCSRFRKPASDGKTCLNPMAAAAPCFGSTHLYSQLMSSDHK